MPFEKFALILLIVFAAAGASVWAAVSMAGAVALPAAIALPVISIVALIATLLVRRLL